MAERKRGYGEGSKPRQRPDGRWEARYTDALGRRRSVYASTRKEVARKAVEAMAHKDDAPVFEPTTITVREFFGQYDEVARDTMKRRSYETYRGIVRKHLLPALGSIKLRNLDRERVQRMYSRKRDAGLSPARIRRIHSVLSSALNTAIRWRYIERNVCREVSSPRVPAPEIRPLSVDEAKGLLAAAEGDRLEALYVLGLTSGARWGESTGLYWSDLDLERRVMHVQRSLIKGKGGYSFDAPKTRVSRRSVGLTVRAVEALRDHRGRQRVAGHAAEGDTLVFTNTVGNPVNHSHFRRNHFKTTTRRPSCLPLPGS